MSTIEGPLGVECTGLALRYGRVRALDGLDLRIEPGESVGIVGRNGAGKSTLFRCIVGAETPDAGAARTIPPLPRVPMLERTGFVPDALSAYDWMRVRDAIAFVESLQPRFDPEWCEQLVAMLALDPAARVQSLSRGMQARLAFVLGLSHRPALLLLDEPLLGVDAVTHDAILEMLARLRAESGCTMLIASHQLGDLARLTDRVVFLERGRIRESVPTEELSGGTARLVVAGPLEAWRAPEGTIFERRESATVTITVGGDIEGAILDIRARQPHARIERIPLSIAEACADRMRALEVQA
ncbi:MAG: ABC transporter ATP-binding protein [Phycisphaerales bacterium]